MGLILFGSIAFARTEALVKKSFTITVVQTDPRGPSRKLISKRLTRAIKIFKDRCNIKMKLEFVKVDAPQIATYEESAVFVEKLALPGKLLLIYGNRFRTFTGDYAPSFAYPKFYVESMASSYAYPTLKKLTGTAWVNFSSLLDDEKEYPKSYSVEAHEIAHLMGLDHLNWLPDYINNLMADTGDSTRLSSDLFSDQCDEIRRHAH